MNPGELLERKHKKFGSYAPLTTFGHAYSLLIEELAEQGVDIQPDTLEFLTYIKDRMKQKKGHTTEIDLRSPCFYYDGVPLIAEYSLSKGLDAKRCSKLMREIIGGEEQIYQEENIERWFKRS